MSSKFPETIKIVHIALTRQIEDIKTTSTMSSLILSVCLVDTLAGFYSGFEGKGGGHEKRFNKFTREFLPEYLDFLHDLRNNLVHSFSNKDLNLMFVLNQEWFEAYPNMKKIFSMEVFNVHEFKESIFKAFDEYFDKLGEIENNDIRSNFMKRYKSLGIIKDAVLPVVRNKKGEIINQLDKMDKSPIKDIPFGFVDPIKTKN